MPTANENPRTLPLFVFESFSNLRNDLVYLSLHNLIINLNERKIIHRYHNRFHSFTYDSYILVAINAKRTVNNELGNYDAEA